jgi:hypothetical protein
MIAYNVGDSFTFPGSWAPDETKHFWHQVAVNYGCTKFVNDSEPGRSNDRIIKLVMQHALENPTANVLYLINITTIYRFDITNTGGDKFHDVLTPKAIAELDFELVECTLYMQLIGLIELLKSQNKPFFVFNNYRNFGQDSLPMRDPFVKYIKAEPRVLNWFDNARADFNEHVSQIKPWDYNELGWAGHDTTQGHEAYYKMLASILPSRFP